MKGISRIHSLKCHGWFVRIYRNSRTISKLFSDQKYGGKSSARRLAMQYQRQKESSLPPTMHPEYSTPPFLLGGKLIKSNKTGINGVCLVYDRQQRRKSVVGFAANYKIKGKLYNKKFSISRYGSKRAALQAAVKFRKKMERSMLRDWKTTRR